MKIKKGDTVQVIAGKDRGKTGKVSRALPETNQVVIDGVNVRKKHERAKQGQKKGEIVSVSSPVHVSNVQLIDPETNTPTRVGIRRENGKRIRVAKKSNTDLT